METPFRKVLDIRFSACPPSPSDTGKDLARKAFTAVVLQEVARVPYVVKVFGLVGSTPFLLGRIFCDPDGAEGDGKHGTFPWGSMSIADRRLVMAEARKISAQSAEKPRDNDGPFRRIEW
jgi:hypothetical protein